MQNWKEDTARNKLLQNAMCNWENKNAALGGYYEILLLRISFSSGNIRNSLVMLDPPFTLNSGTQLPELCFAVAAKTYTSWNPNPPNSASAFMSCSPLYQMRRTVSVASRQARKAFHFRNVLIHCSSEGSTGKIKQATKSETCFPKAWTEGWQPGLFLKN